MDLTPTRRTLHGIAELLLAGPQYAASGTIRLRAVPGGLTTVAAPALRLDSGELVSETGRHPLTGTFADAAAALGVEPRPLDDVYSDSTGVTPDESLDVDPAALAVLVDALAAGDAALRAFAPDQEPVVWPEHLDVGISMAAEEVNYGVSPGDSFLGEPYAYVGPWKQRTGDFWNQSFGAAVPLTELAATGAALEEFFRQGSERAASDPVAD
jgi:hypothetical protein